MGFDQFIDSLIFKFKQKERESQGTNVKGNNRLGDKQKEDIIRYMKLLTRLEQFYIQDQLDELKVRKNQGNTKRKFKKAESIDNLEYSATDEKVLIDLN